MPNRKTQRRPSDSANSKPFERRVHRSQRLRLPVEGAFQQRSTQQRIETESNQEAALELRGAASEPTRTVDSPSNLANALGQDGDEPEHGTQRRPGAPDPVSEQALHPQGGIAGALAIGASRCPPGHDKRMSRRSPCNRWRGRRTVATQRSQRLASAVQLHVCSLSVKHVSAAALIGHRVGRTLSPWPVQCAHFASLGDQPSPIP